MTQVLVTGATGFIGRVLCRNLQNRKVQVRGLMRKNCNGFWDEFALLDLASKEIPSSIMSGVDTVFHLAGKAHAVSERVQQDAAYHHINVEGTRRLLNAAVNANVRSFIFFSSIKATGEGGEALLDEDCRLPPETPYGRSKREAENLVLNSTGIPHVTILRPAMVYGPENPGNMGRMISGIKRGFFPPFPKINNQRSMVHVEDVVQAALLAADNPQANKKVYVVTDGQLYSTRQIYEWICQALDKTVPGYSVPLSVLKGLARLGDGIGVMRKQRFMFDSDALAKLTGSAAYSSAKIQKELGFSPKWTLDQALPSIVKSYLQKA